MHVYACGPDTRVLQHFLNGTEDAHAGTACRPRPLPSSSFYLPLDSLPRAPEPLPPPAPLPPRLPTTLDPDSSSPRMLHLDRSARKLPTFRIGSTPQIARRARAREWGLGQQRARLSPIKSCPVLVSPAVANALHVRPGVCFRMQTHVCTAVLGTLLYRVVSYSQSLRQQSL